MVEKTLTERQKQVLELIRRHMVRQGAPPTIRELREGLKLKSLRGVTVHLDALVRKGFIDRSRQARGIRLTNVVRDRSDDQEMLAEIEPVYIPILGRIAAGEPVLAEQHVEGRLAVDPRWVPGPGCFALRIHGSSMIGAGIMDKDFVMVRQQPTAQNGEIVAVLVDNEATVKKFYQERGGKVRLQPENPAMEPIFVHPRDKTIQILGKVVGLFRQI